MVYGWAIVLLACGICGCGMRYGPALYDTNLPAPVPFSPNARGGYAAADFTRGNGYNDGERTVGMRGHYMIADGEGVLRWSYGGFVYGGSYQIQSSMNDRLRGPREFGGLGAEGDVSFSEQFGGVAIGGGVYAAVGLELAPYALLWRMRGYLPHLAAGGVYATVGTPLGDRAQGLALQLGLGMPGLVTLNGQIALDDVVIWGGVGASLNRYPGIGDMRRVGIGMAVNIK